jgi:GNAT superfamily N-acetyltransferase
MDIRHLPTSSIDLIARIDRTEAVDYAYEYVDGHLERIGVDWKVPPWDAEGIGPHSVQVRIDTWGPAVRAGGRILGAFDGDDVAGLAIVVPEYEPDLAWLAFLHVTAPHRRSGVGTSLWNEAETASRASGARHMYVSATTSGPTVDFYLRRGCVLVPDPHPELYAKEPEDIHLVKVL